MKIYPTTLLSARWDIEASVDLTSASARVQIEEDWYPMAWVSLSLPTVDGFVRTAEVSLGGMDSTAAAKVLESQEPLVEVTVNGETLVDKSSVRLDVV